MHVFLPDDTCVFDRKGQAQHDEIGVRPIETVRVIGQETVLVGTNKLHDLVLPLTRSVRPRENNR